MKSSKYVYLFEEADGTNTPVVRRRVGKTAYHPLRYGQRRVAKVQARKGAVR